MKKQIGIYSGLHFLVDFLCSAAMFGNFIRNGSGYFWILIYNFCAFALQMPFGIILDRLDDSGMRQSAAVYTMIMGIVLTILGTFANPVILGIGNAMFHIGGGICSVREDEAGNYHGAGLGVFVAPGALGLYIGTLFSKGGWYVQCRMAGVVSVGILLWILIRYGQESKWIAEKGPENEEYLPGKMICICFICFIVVILRSYIGMAVVFPWKVTLADGVLCVLAVVMGKIAGGFLAAKVGIAKAAVYSLGIAAVLYLLSDIAAAGILALFFFNMSMPMTLYLLVKQYPKAAGFSFGLLTFGLFMGFLPIYLGFGNLSDGCLAGSVGSIISLVLLYSGGRVNHADLSV